LTAFEVDGRIPATLQESVMSQKHPHRDRERAAQLRRKQTAEKKKAKKTARVKARAERESK
jgi:hypothetical protein